MNDYKKKKNFFIWSILLCITVSVLLTSILSYTLKKSLIDQFVGMQFILDSNVDFDGSLFYTYSKDFDANLELRDTNESKDTLFFIFPKESKLIKKFRLDFGNDTLLKEIKIKALQIIFKDKKITFDQDKVFNSFFLNSASVALNKNTLSVQTRSAIKPFDPYIVFSPLGEICLEGYSYRIALLLPFVFLIIFYTLRIRNDYKLTIVEFLLLIFIICIPLKIAWTTFCALLLCAYGIAKLVYRKKLGSINGTFYVLIAIFCWLVLFGRPSSLSVIDKQWALPLFGVVSMTISLPKRKTYKYFVFTMLILNAVIVASSINFLFWFNDFYALGILDYFKDIKIYSSNVRDWLYYDHAAFLSFFGLIGLLFLHELRNKEELDKKIVYLYHTLLVLLIILIGSRICLLIYAIFLLNSLMKWNIKRRILINSLLFVSVTALLFIYIQKVDLNRYHLWSVSWEAIKGNPWLGYGLGKSDELLHNIDFINSAGFTEALRLNHSHNQFITFFLEIGILGVLAIVLTIFYFLYSTKQYKNKSLVLFLFGLGYIFLTESILQTSKPLYIICFLFLLITNEPKENFKLNLVKEK